MNFNRLNPVEHILVEKGYDKMSGDDKNELISFISRKKSKSSGQRIPFNHITDEYIFEYHQKLKKGILSDICNERIVKGFVSHNGHHYRTNRDDQMNFYGQVLELQLDPDMKKVFWKTEDAGYLEHPREEWLVVFREGIEHKRELLFRYDMLKAQVFKATTHDEIVAVSWE